MLQCKSIQEKVLQKIYLISPMYKMIFYYFYRYFLYRNDDSPRFGAICGIFLTIGLHINLAYVIVQKLVGRILLNPMSSTYYWNKALNMLVILPFFFLAIVFFNKCRVNGIIKEYESKQNVFSVWNWLLFLLFTVGALISIIFLLKK